MRQRLAAAKAEILRQPMSGKVTANIKTLCLTRPVQRRKLTIIHGVTAAEKAQTLWDTWLRERMQP
jgi:hypothetical protein